MDPLSALGVALGEGVAKGIGELISKELIGHWTKSSGTKSRKTREALRRAIETYSKSLEKSTKYVPTIAIQGVAFTLDEIYEPLTLVDKRGSSHVIKSFPRELFSDSSKVLVVDSAGMGKSTLTRFLLRAIFRESNIFPFFVELRRVQGEQTLQDFIINSVVENVDNIDLREAIREIARSSESIFLLDGYDEIDEQQRKRLTGQIQTLAEEFPGAKFWLTSRPDSALAGFLGFSEYKIAPLEKAQAYSLLRRYGKGQGKAEQLIQRISTVPQVSEFLGNPLLVTLLYKAFDFKATIPLKKTIFYRQVFDALFQDHDLSKSGAFERKKRSDLDVEDFHKALRSLAMVCMKSGKAQYSLEEFHELLLASARLVVGVAIDAASFKEDLLTAVPLFVRDGQEVRWAHKSFQDYFISQFVIYDLGERQMDFVRKLLLTSNATKHVEMLSFVAEADLGILRRAFIRSYVLELRDGFGAQSSSEADFALYYLSKIFSLCIVTESRGNGSRAKDDYHQRVHSIIESEDHSKGARTWITWEPPFGYAWVGLIRGQEHSLHAALAKLDPVTFNTALVLKKGVESSELEKLCSTFDFEWKRIGELVDVRDTKKKLSLVRASLNLLDGDIPSLSSIKELLGNQGDADRDAELDELMNSVIGRV